jgi:hypothetical protein
MVALPWNVSWVGAPPVALNAGAWLWRLFPKDPFAEVDAPMLPMIGIDTLKSTTHVYVLALMPHVQPVI